MLNVGGPELLIILLVALVFLGPQRLPELARQMGQAVSSLRSLASGFQAELEAAAKPDRDSSMKLDGPTSTSEAIAKTQRPGAAGTADPYKAAARAGDPDGVAPDGVAPDGVAPDGVAPDGVAPDGVAPDSGAGDSVAPDSGAGDSAAAPPGDRAEPTKAEKLAAAARQVKHGGEVKPVSAGGPQDLRPEAMSSPAATATPDAADEMSPNGDPEPDKVEPGEREWSTRLPRSRSMRRAT